MEVITKAAQIDVLHPKYKNTSIFREEAIFELEKRRDEAIPNSVTSSTYQSDSPQKNNAPPLPEEIVTKKNSTDSNFQARVKGLPRWKIWVGVTIVVLTLLGILYFLQLHSNTKLTFPTDAVLGDVGKRAKDDMNMVYVPGGTFFMGSADGDDDELPVHEMTVQEFWIDETEVTNEQFTTFVADTNHVTTAEREGSGWVLTENDWEEIIDADWRHPQGPDSDIGGLEQHPVVLISWDDAHAYCQWLGARLPTEVEWEYAARGPESLIFPWGNDFQGENANFCDANCPDEYDRDSNQNDKHPFTAPVYSYPNGESWVFTYEMGGNVWEWVNDWYDENYLTNDSSNLETNTYKVLRGGSWADEKNTLRAANRLFLSPTARSNVLGFRCAASDN